MSDNISFSVVVTEGIHDVAFLARVLELKGFREARHLDEIPDGLKNIIPKKYPFEGLELSRRVPYPSFFSSGENWVLLSNAGGVSKLTDTLKELLSIPLRQDILSGLRGTAVLTDADAASADEARTCLFQMLADAFQASGEFCFDPASPEHLVLYQKPVPFATYIFPDDQGAGTLEHILLTGAQINYPNLTACARNYIDYAQGLPCAASRLAGNNREKALVGAIANVLRPGRAPQSSIRDDRWFTADDLSTSPLHRGLSDFVDLILSWHTAAAEPSPV